MPKFVDLTGQKFGRLLVIERGPDYLSGGRKRFKWKCLCDCGNVYYTRGDALKSGATQSCGCLNKELSAEKGKARTIDLTGKTFGYLTVLERAGSDQRREALWLCQCKCGSPPIKVLGSNLRTGHTASCGCKTISTGELAIIQLLTENNIPFETQKSFKNCVFEDTNRQAKFDFYVDNQYLIEYDGEQHFRPDAFHTTEEEFQRIQWKDGYKNKWCKENSIPLIRIPYTHLKNLTINDIILTENNKFITKE